MINPNAKHDQSVRRIIVIEGLFNLLVLLVKLIVGLSANSLAILGDAIHSLTDVVNNIIAWVIVKTSNQPADRKHPYGHRKFEVLAVFGLATLLTVLSLELARHAIIRETTTTFQTRWGLLLMLIVLFINIGLATWQHYWAQQLRSNILLADASHTFADVLTTAVIILGWQLSARGYPWLDTACALGVAGLILYLAFNLFRRVVPVLVDEVAIEPDLLSKAVYAVDGVRRVQRIRSRWIGSTCAVDMIVSVDDWLSTSESHAIADAIETALENEFSIQDVTIHIEPN